MELSNQVCSLELAKKLKEFGVKQESLFCWSAREGIDGKIKDNYWHLTTAPFRDDIPSFHSEDCDSHISAFTVAELGEMLSKCHFNSDSYDITFGIYHTGTFKNIYCSLKYDSHDDKHFESNTEADCRAKMLIYLLENKLITLKK